VANIRVSLSRDIPLTSPHLQDLRPMETGMFAESCKRKKGWFEGFWRLHVDRSAASHHNIVVFVEFHPSREFGERVTQVVVCRDVRVVDLFFFGPLEDYKVFHIDMSGASCQLSCIGELSCVVVIGKYLSW
jgi:hypothetical protein